MEDITELGDWELLQNSAKITDSSHHNSSVKPDYFTFDSTKNQAPRVLSPGEEEEEDTDGGVDSDNPSSHGEVGPDSMELGYKNSSDADSVKDLGLGEREKQSDLINKVDSQGIENKNNKKRVVAWWEIPLELLKWSALRVRPVWSVSFAFAFLGLVLLGRKLYNRMRQKSKSVSILVSMENKRPFKFARTAANPSKALSAERNIPIITSSPSSGGLTPWALLALR